MARKKRESGGAWWMPYVWCAVFAGCIWYGLAHDGFWQGVMLCVVVWMGVFALFYLWWCILTPSGCKASFDIPADAPQVPAVPYWDEDDLHTEQEEGYKHGYLDGYDEGYEKGQDKASDVFLFGDDTSIERLEKDAERFRFDTVGPVFPDDIPDEYFDAYKYGYKVGRRDGYKDGICDGYDDESPKPTDTGGAWVPGVGIDIGMGNGLGGSG